MTSRSVFGLAATSPTDPSTARAHVLSLVADRLVLVERLFRENLESPTEIVNELGGFVGDGGGKRIRPTLHLLCAKLCRYDGPHDVLLGSVLEFIHCATLIHDDIIDEASTRRGRPSVNATWGNNVSVLFGDYMFAKAMDLALRAESLEVMQRLATVTLNMTEGEMLQTRYEGRLDLSVDEYLDLVEKKTASLFACCCELAGLLAGVDGRRLDALRRYGANLGMTFQLVDDLLDYTSDDATLGKPAATDLREGKATLAVLELLADRPEPARPLAERIVAGDDDGAAIDELTGLLHDSGAIERARVRARAHARTAVEQVDAFDDGPAARALRMLPEILLDRDR